MWLNWNPPSFFEIHTILKITKQTQITYTFSDAPVSGWKVWTGILDAAELDITCGECEKDVDCNYHGSCKDKRCICDEPWIGNKCQTWSACSRLDPAVTAEYYGTEFEEPLAPFEQLKDIEVYERPVYYKKTEEFCTFVDGICEDLPPGTVEIMFYAGTRFYISHWREFMLNPDEGIVEADLAKMREYFNDFHSTWHLDDNKDKRIIFYTKATSNPMPLDVEWYVVKEGNLAIISGAASELPKVATVSFECAIESEKNLCSFGF